MKNYCIYKVLRILVPIVIFLSLNPFFLWETYSYSVMIGYIYRVLIILVAIILWLYILMEEQRIVQRKKIYIIIYMLSFYIFQHVHTFNDEKSIELGALLLLLIAIGLIMLREEQRQDILSVFIKLFAISLLSGIVFALLNYVKLPIKYSELASTHPDKVSVGRYYKHYFGCVFLEQKGAISFIHRNKLCGMFDEPGAVGTIGGLLLAGRSLDEIRKDRYLQIILLGGILSLSLAFYVIFGLFILGNIILHGIKRIKKEYIWIAIVSVIILCIMMGNSTIRNRINNVLFIKLYNAIATFTSGAERVGSNYMIQFKEMVVPNIIWGLGYGAKELPAFSNASSIIDLVLEYGILGCLFYLLNFIVIFLFLQANGYKKNIIFVIIYFMSIYQRPQVFNLAYLMIYITNVNYIPYLPSKRCNKNHEIGPRAMN